MSYSTSPDGAIDLDRLRRQVMSTQEANEAAAAVEALRERNTTLLRKNGERAKWASDANDRADAAEAREAALMADLAEEESEAEHYLRLAIVDPGANDQISWKDRADAAEAREAALAGALEATLDLINWKGLYTKEREILTAARAVLAATPANALERSRAVEAREAALAGLVDALLQNEPDDMAADGITVLDVWRKEARTVLAVTPAQAQERARAVTALIAVADVVIDSGARLRSEPGTHELMLASLCSVMADLARLDAMSGWRL